MSATTIPIHTETPAASPFPLDQWYVAGFSADLKDQPLARTFLNRKVVLFRTAAWPFGDTCDRWQEIEFDVSHLRIWTGAVEPGTDAIDDPDRGGFHMRGFHGITPETDTTCHYFWSMASTSHPDMPPNIAAVLSQTEFTFDEDRIVIEAQYKNIVEFGGQSAWIDIHVDAGGNRARRIVQRLTQPTEAVT